MTPELIVIIVLSSLGLVANILSPLIVSSAYLIRNVKQCESCCGSKLLVDDADDISVVENKEMKEQMNNIDLKGDALINTVIQNLRKESLVTENEIVDVLNKSFSKECKTARNSKSPRRNSKSPRRNSKSPRRNSIKNEPQK